jgi:predicted  nucleic acid-binding Zn-ribbon protein
MAWFLNFYRCDRCSRVWKDEWSCMCDDECPHCGMRDMSPFKSNDLTELVAPDGDQFAILRSPETAEHDPDYAEIGRVPTRAKAEAFLAQGD